jgi:Family of unknown function (DUF6496)
MLQPLGSITSKEKGPHMPEKRTLKRVAADKRAGKAASTQAGEFVREEMDHIREGKHGARSAKQAIAIGLSKARRAGVKLAPPRSGSAALKRQAARDASRGAHPKRVSPRRSAAALTALKREPHSAASHLALARHAHGAAAMHTAAERSAAAQKAAKTRSRQGKK